MIKNKDLNNRVIRTPNYYSLWMLILIVLVVAMILVGGATRLTNSGLSMVLWQPLSILPPLNFEQWLIEFNHYKISPEYLKLNMGMQLNEFKNIYYWEYGHRLLGRLLGCTIIVPLFIWWFKLTWLQRISMLSVGLICAAQGAVGWWMVKSGLKHNPFVSPLRLAIHLSIAFVMLAILWKQWQLSRGQSRHLSIQETRQQSRQYAWQYLLAIFVSLTLFYGALVAGLKAGYVYNTFPLMNDHFLPEQFLKITPLWQNFFYNQGAVQFIHRYLAMMSLGLATALYVYYRSTNFLWLILALLVQVALGIMTLLLQVPLGMGLLHQGWAIVVWFNVLNLLNRK